MDILKWNKETQEWEIAVPGTDQLDPLYINPTFSVDVEITNSAKGVILKSATKRWRVTINDSGVFVVTEI